MKHALRVILLSALPVITQGAVTLSLSVEPASLLPGIPPTFHVIATNNGSASAELYPAVALQVTPPQGDPFIAHTKDRDEAFVTSFHFGSTALTLAPKESRDISFWSGPDDPVWFVADPRLFAPGKYRFQLISDRALQSALLPAAYRAIQQAGLVEPVVSNEATFTVDTPAGIDAEVFKLIRTNPVLWNSQFASVIAAQYPKSTYAAYVVPSVDDRIEQIRWFQTAIDKKPLPTFAEWYRFSIAQIEIVTLRPQDDFEGAVQIATHARTTLEDLAKRALVPEIKDRATDLLANRNLTREQLASFVKAQRGEGELSVDACIVTALDGVVTVYFGFSNPQTKEITLPIGEENKFTSPPFERGQPTAFKPGIFYPAFSVPMDGPELTWHIGRSNIQVTRKTATCPDFAQQ